MPERRTLNFNGLDGVMPEVERLLTGHETTGRWTLGQILYHLVVGIRLSMEGKSEAEPVEGRDPSRVYRRLFFRSDRFPENTHPPLAILIPPDSCDPHEQAEALREAIERFTSNNGAFSSHPVLGSLSKAEWMRFHGMHCAHHLGFAMPTAGDRSPTQ